MAVSPWTQALVPIGVALSFALFRRICPALPADFEGPPLTDEERRVYQRWEVGALIPFFAFTALLGSAWYFALKGAADLCWQVPPGTRFLVRIPSVAWMLPALFLGIISAAIPMEWLYRGLLGDRLSRYERACIERVGFDARRVLVWMVALVVAGATAFFWAAVSSFARFDELGVEVGHPLASRSAFRPYASVRAIEHRNSFVAPNGNIIPRSSYLIRFDDGSTWSTGGLFHDPRRAEDGPIARLVSDRSGLPIVERP